MVFSGWCEDQRTVVTTVLDKEKDDVSLVALPARLALLETGTAYAVGCRRRISIARPIVKATAVATVFLSSLGGSMVANTG